MRSAVHAGGITSDAELLGSAPLGHHGPVLALLDWAQACGVETAQLRQALTSKGGPQPLPLPTFRRIITDIQNEVAADGKSGWGLFAGEQTQEPLWILIPSDPATTLLATATAAVGISEDGLQLLRRGITLTGWHITERELIVTTPRGERRLGPATLSAQLLRYLTRGAEQVELRRVPLTDLLTPVLNMLTDVAAAESHRADELFVTTW